MKKIILASASPRRRELLFQLGITDFEVVAPECDERAFSALPPGEMAVALSRAKAESALTKAGAAARESAVIACDTIVVLGGAVFGKPEGARGAASMLSALSGKKHTVMSGLTVVSAGQTVSALEKTDVFFRALRDWEIESYVRTGEPFDKAGGYGIQGFAAAFAERIEGDYFNVVGLPLCRLWSILSDFGAVGA